MSDATAEIEYTKADSVSESENLTRLYYELTGKEIVPDVSRINKLIAENRLFFYTASCNKLPVGMVSVVPCRTSMKDKYWIEDVAVLSDCRGKGVGRALLDFAIKDISDRFGEGVFYLTSRPSRTAARKLYTSMGFE